MIKSFFAGEEEMFALGSITEWLSLEEIIKDYSNEEQFTLLNRTESSLLYWDNEEDCPLYYKLIKED